MKIKINFYLGDLFKIIYYSLRIIFLITGM